MPIDRDGKHWCAPDAETPDAAGLWSCECGTGWHFDPAWRVWEPVPKPAPEPDPLPEPKPDPEPVPEDTGGAE